MSEKKNVIESAEHSMEEAIRQGEMGYEFALSEVRYWAAFLDGARAQKAEDEMMAEKENT